MDTLALVSLTVINNVTSHILKYLFVTTRNFNLSLQFERKDFTISYDKIQAANFLVSLFVLFLYVISKRQTVDLAGKKQIFLLNFVHLDKKVPKRVAEIVEEISSN